jgi:hypothetical protein
VVTVSGQSELPHPAGDGAATGPRPPQKHATSRTSRSRAIRSTACVLRPATVRTGRAPVLATGQPQPDRQCSRPATARADAAQIVRPDPDRAQDPVARTLRSGTGQPQTERPARDRCVATRRCPASRRRCTRLGSSQPGIAAVTAREGHQRLPARPRVPSRRLAAQTAVRRPGRRPQRRGAAPGRRAITSGQTALRPSLATPCWPSVTRPRM